MTRITFIVFAFFIMVSAVHGGENPITRLQEETIAYFKPMTGTVTAVDANTVTMSVGEKDGAKAGMRFKILREGEPFIHPVTKELLGKVESTVGKVEVKEVQAESAKGVVVEGAAKEGDKVRLSDTKVRMIFCQDKNIDWYLADEYYRKLKATGRIEMIDTALETGDESKVLEEARRLGAEVALILTAAGTEKETLLRERLFWVSDGSKFVDKETKVGPEYSKELKFGEEFFTPRVGEAVMMFDLPFGSQLMAMGDIYGDGKKEIMLSSGRNIRIYRTGVDLQPLGEIKGSAGDDFIWLDAIDLNKNGKDEIVVTSMKNGEIVSYIYEFSESGFKLMWQGKYFLRKLGEDLIAQAYSSWEGFSGDIFKMTWNGEYNRGEKIVLPKEINIYDFVYIQGDAKEPFVFAYDDRGFLNLYDERGTRVWRSSADAGGFLTTFKKKSPVVFRDAGEWAVKDRLVARQREILAIQRVPFLAMAKGLGYKSSRLRDYWWNGFSMEEGVLIDGIKGTVLDYALSGDTVAVLTSPFMGIKFSNILKGENPLGTVLYIYSIKGR